MVDKSYLTLSFPPPSPIDKLSALCALYYNLRISDGSLLVTTIV